MSYTGPERRAANQLWHDENRWLVAGVLLAVFIALSTLAFAVIRTNQALREVEREANLRTYTLCVEANKVRTATRAFVDELTDREDILAIAQRQFADMECPPSPLGD